MSRLWPRVRIAMTPSHVAVANGKTYRESAVATSGWPGAVKTLSGLLADAEWRGRADVILSHHFAHVHCLPSPPVMLRPAEVQGWIRDYLDRQYGEAGKDWQLAWQSEPPGKPFLAGSIATSSLTEVEEVIRSASLKPASIQPWLAAAWTRNHRRFGNGQAWYALVEPGRLMLARVAAGNISRLRTALMQDDTAAPLAELVRREALLAGETAEAPIWIDSVLLRADWREMGGSIPVRLLATSGESIASMLGN